MFHVFEADKPAFLPDTKVDDWKGNVFETKRKAEVYAYLWCYRCTHEEAERDALEMELNKKYNMSTGEFPVMMEIREIV
jgi:hypothetical protein